MKEKATRFFNYKTGFLFLIVVLFCSPALAYANAGEPTQLIIIVQNPPEDLVIELMEEDGHPWAHETRRLWEGYYYFHADDMQDGKEFTIRASYGSEVLLLDGHLYDYPSIYSLHLEEKTLTKGKSFLRSIGLVFLRLFLTLLIEGVIFFAFGYRRRKSYLSFMVLNIFTQGALNIWLNSLSDILNYYLVIALVIGEFFVFIIEGIIGSVIYKEKSKKRAVGFIIISNIVSLILGGVLISLLPV